MVQGATLLTVVRCVGQTLASAPRAVAAWPGNAPLWKKDFGAEAALASVRVDPGDVRRLVLCGQRGVLIVLKLTNPARDRVEQQQYKVRERLGRCLHALPGCTAFARPHAGGVSYELPACSCQRHSYRTTPLRLHQNFPPAKSEITAIAEGQNDSRWPTAGGHERKQADRHAAGLLLGDAGPAVRAAAAGGARLKPGTPYPVP